MKEEKTKAARFQKGTRVRVRSSGWLQSAYSNTWKYQNMSGEIADSVSVAGYLVRSWQGETETPPETLYLYRVRFDTGVVEEYLTEDCLERLAEAGK